MALSGKSLNDFCCNWNCSQTNMKFISTHSISHFHMSEEPCVCVWYAFPAGAAWLFYPPLQGQYLQFIFFYKITLSQRFTISLSLCASIPPPLSPPAACHICCMSQWLSVIKANYSLFWACGASCGSNTLLATHSCRSIPPSICVPCPLSLSLSLPRSSCMYSM